MSEEVKTIYQKEMARLASKVNQRLGVQEPAGGYKRGERPAVPMPLIIAEAVKEDLSK